MAEGDLTREEMVEILEGIARDASDGLKIQAIRVLLSMQSSDENVDEEALERLIRTK